MARIAGSIELGVGPSVRGFWKEFNVKLKKEKAPTLDVSVHADTKRASAELAAWRRVQERNALNIPVEIDKASIRRASQTMRRIETTFTRSRLSKAIRIQVAVAGATALPALAQGALSAASALTDLGRAALVLPGIFSGLAASLATAVVGLKGVGAAFDAAKDSAKDAEKNMRDYQRATRELQDAQRGVIQALKDANREIQDQRDKLTQGALSIEQAQINLQRARERLAQGGFESMSEYRQAILDVKQAHFDLGQAIKNQSRDVQDYYDNAAKGARQTDTFRDAVDRLATATENLAEAEKKASGASDKFVEAMQNLSPAAQDFVNKVRSLEGAWKGLQNAVSNSLLAGIGDAIVDLANRRLPLLQAGMVQIAGSINSVFRSMLQNIGSEMNAVRFNQIFDRTARAIDLMRPGINSLTNAFIHLSEAGSRFLPRLANAFNTVMGRFENFLKRADEDGSLERWIDRGLDLLSSLGRSIGHIGSILGSVQEAYEKATGNVGGFAATLERNLGKLANWLSSPEGQRTLIGYIRQAQLFMDTIGDFLPGIIDAFQAFGEISRHVATTLYPLFSAIGRFAQDHLALIKPIVTWYLVWKSVGAPLWHGLSKFWGRLNTGVQAYKKSVDAARKAHEELVLAAQGAERNRQALMQQDLLARKAVTDARELEARAGAELAIIEKQTQEKERQARDELKQKKRIHEASVQEFLLAKQAQQINKDTLKLQADMPDPADLAPSEEARKQLERTHSEMMAHQRELHAIQARNVEDISDKQTRADVRRLNRLKSDLSKLQEQAAQVKSGAVIDASGNRLDDILKRRSEELQDLQRQLAPYEAKQVVDLDDTVPRLKAQIAERKQAIKNLQDEIKSLKKETVPLLDAQIARKRAAIVEQERLVGTHEEKIRQRLDVSRQRWTQQNRVIGEALAFQASAMDRADELREEAFERVIRDREKIVELQQKVSRTANDVVVAEQNVTNTVKRGATERAEAQATVNQAMRNTRLATEAQVAIARQYDDAFIDLALANHRVAKSADELDSKFGRLRRAIGTRGGGGGLIGVMGSLSGALGKVGTAIGGAAALAVSAGLIYALDQLTQAHQRSAAAADNQRQSEEALANTLAEGTGAATRATAEENLRQLKDSPNPFSPDDQSQHFDAAKILEQQLGLSPHQAAALTLGTEVDKLNRAFAQADQRIINSVHQLKDWKKFGDQYRAAGVDERTYGLALNGDRDAIAKVDAARHKIARDRGVPRTAFALASQAGLIPHDLPNVREKQLGSIDRGLLDLSKALDAARGIQFRNIDAGRAQQEFSQANELSGPGLGKLNQEAHKAFGFLRPNWTSVDSNGEITIATDVRPRPDWVEGARDRGIEVTEREPDGAIIHIDREAARRYGVPNLARGGQVFGAGTATSDSIPAFLSNGEFVFNAKAAKFWGGGLLHAMNNTPGAGGMRFDKGGMVGWWDPRFIAGGASASGSVKATNAITTESGPGVGVPSEIRTEVLSTPDATGSATAKPTAKPAQSTPSRPLLPFPGSNTAHKSGPQTLPEAIGVPVPERRATVGDYANAAVGQVLGTLLGTGLDPKSVHPELRGRTNFVADLPRAILSSYGVPVGDLPGSGPRKIYISRQPLKFGSNLGAVKGRPSSSLFGRMFGNVGSTPGAPSSGSAATDSTSAPHLGDKKEISAGPDGVATSPGTPGPITAPTHGQRAGAAPGPAPSGGSSTSPNFPSYEELNSTTAAQWRPSNAPRVGADIPGGSYVPNLSGNGVIMENDVTARSAVKNAPINPDANILDYLRQVGKAYGLYEGTSTVRPEEPTSQHATGRAIDLGGGDPKWSDPAAVEAFVQDWISDPTKVAATRQLIFSAPSGRKYGIINGRLLSDQEAMQVYGSDFPGHADHVHLALEGVPLSAFTDSGGGVPIPGGTINLPDATTAPPGSIAAGIPGINAPLQGPFGPIPFQPFDFLKEIGQAILGAILGFFGINIGPIIDIINKIAGGVSQVGPASGDTSLPGLPPDPGPDQQIVQDLLQEAAAAKEAGDEKTARALYDLAREYAGRPLQNAQASQSPDGVAAPPANYSGGTPEVHNAVYRAFKEAGFSDDQWGPLVELLNHENGTWDPLRPTSDPNSDAKGIFQFLSTTWDAVGMEPSDDPYIQAVAGMRYIKQRYGTPAAAWAHWQNPTSPPYDQHWYRHGGPVALSAGGPVKGSGSTTSDSIPALLSNGEFVLNAAATRRIGVHRLNQMNQAPKRMRKRRGGFARFDVGGAVGLPLPWINFQPTQQPGPLNLDQPGVGSAAGQSLNQNLGGWLSRTAEGAGSVASAALAPKGGGRGASWWGGRQPSGPGPQGGQPQGSGRGAPDARSVLQAPQGNSEHLHPALRAGIEGAWSTVGALAGSAAAAGLGALNGVAPGAGSVAGGAASQLIAAGAQIGGQVASGVANVISSLGVGTVSPTGAGYGAPLLPAMQQPQQTYQSIHNGDIVAFNPSEAFDVRDRKDKQRTLALMNRS